ncbi:MAG: tetratricopeptide repeat protein [Syntrophobacterales bacterium]|jgi:tetratricopeptide (TPR) repeat protein|nr:tetratricopeptide repeat protein [Syntrophobacterales bacterium]
MKRAYGFTVALLLLVLLPTWVGAQDVQSYVNKGIENSQAGRYEQAIKDFDQALKLKPQDPALITYKGVVYYAKGNNSQAMQLFEEALKLNPSFARAYYQRGMIYLNTEKYDQALADITKAKALGYGVDPDFIAMIKRKMGDQR